MSNEGQRKRLREVLPSIEDVMYYGRFIIEKDPFKHRAPREEDSNFRALFGCGPQVFLDLWNRLFAAEIIPQGGIMKHMLWTLLYHKTYAKWKTMRRLTETDPKTLRKWIGLFSNAICLIEGDVVCLYVFTRIFHCEVDESHIVKFAHRFSGRIDTKVTDRMIVWCLLTPPTALSLFKEENFIRTSTSLVLLYATKSLCAS